MARRRKAVGRGRTARGAGRASSRSSNVAERAQTKDSAMLPLESEQGASPAKRNPRTAAARGKWSEERLLTSDKSELINHDLVKLLAKPEAWNVLEESEKREILALLPTDTHPEADLTADNPDAKIPPLPESFVRYSNNWRAGIRQFQVDLENGRYDPEWLLQAESARQQRERGDFDFFKEREFEHFWGQKQKMDMRLSAGESGRIPLGTLIRAGVILPGDVWRYVFVFGKGADRFVVDKECRVHEINGSKLTFVIPTGTRAFLTSAHNGAQETKKLDQATGGEETKKGSPEANGTSQSYKISPQEMACASNETKAETPPPAEQGETLKACDEPPRSPCMTSNPEGPDNHPPVEVVIVSPKGDSTTAMERHKRTIPQPATEPPAKRKRCRPRKVVPVEPEPESEMKEPENTDTGPIRPEPVPPARETNEPQHSSQPSNTNENILQTEQDSAASSPLSEPPEDLTKPPSQPTADEPEEVVAKPEEVPDKPAEIHDITEEVAAKSDEPSAANVPDEIIVPNIASPNMLVTKILQIDGRPKEGQRTANAWKEIRCYRKNQDMGSLWDVRQAWYFKQHPT